MIEKFIVTKSTLENYYIGKGYSYIKSLMRQCSISKLILIMIKLYNKNKLLKYFKIFSKKFIFQKKKKINYLRKLFLN